MDVPLRTAMTVEAFLGWESRQELRHEFDGTKPVAMVGGTYRHDRINTNLYRLLGNALNGAPCQCLSSNFKLRLERTIRYPDAMVVCHPIDPAATYVTDATVIFEIISPSTARSDRLAKNNEYRALPSLTHYVMIEQEFAGALVIERANGVWSETALDETATLTLPSIGVALPIADLYAGLPIAEPE